MFTSDIVREEDCERKALGERIAAKLAGENQFRRVYLELAAKWREKAEIVKRRRTQHLA
jgi:hypothetical protein